MSYVYSDMSKKQQSNDPGTLKYIYLAPNSLFSAIAAPAAVGAGDGDTVEITGDHTFGVGDGFVKMYTTYDTQELVSELTGERDSKIFNNKFSCQHPGLDKLGIEFAQWAKDDEFIVLIPMVDGSFLQLGREDFGCDVNAKLGSGKNTGGYKGYTFDIESFGTPYIYAGTVTEKV